MSKQEGNHHHEPLKSHYVGVTTKVEEPTKKQRKIGQAALAPLWARLGLPNNQEVLPPGITRVIKTRIK